jgi:hypothetical protein
VTVADVLRATDFVVQRRGRRQRIVNRTSRSSYRCRQRLVRVFVLGAAPRSLRDIDDLRGTTMSLTRTTVVAPGLALRAWVIR